MVQYTREQKELGSDKKRCILNSKSHEFCWSVDHLQIHFHWTAFSTQLAFQKVQILLISGPLTNLLSLSCIFRSQEGHSVGGIKHFLDVSQRHFRRCHEKETVYTQHFTLEQARLPKDKKFGCLVLAILQKSNLKKNLVFCGVEWDGVGWSGMGRGVAGKTVSRLKSP